MRTWVAILFASMIIIISCEDQASHEPLPPIALLIDLTLDLHLAEGPMARVGREQRDSIGLIVRKKIAAKHGIAYEYLEETMARLQLNPILNVQIYDSVVVRLAKMHKNKSIQD